MRRMLLIAMVVCCASPVLAGGPPSRYSVDAPELAQLGSYAVGIRTMHLVQHGQVDVLAPDAAKGTAALIDRALTVELWYPARAPAGAARVVYEASLPSEPPAPAARFSIPGIAVRDAPPVGRDHPLVIVSHGYSNDPDAMTWLTENLASKGYVVAAIAHDDPPITDRTRFAQPLMRRPLDIAFVAQTLQRTLADEHLVDPARIALVGYSMGGYGVLTAAGATLDPDGGAIKRVPGNLMLPFARGGAMSGSLLVKGLRAVVAISPAGAGTLASWGAEGLRAISAPLLLIAGDDDRTVDYRTGARAIFDAASGAHRYLLTFKGGGHAMGLNPVPDAMRNKLWDQDWFEDPVWRKDRINAINAHFITAFLDLYVKGDADRAAYLNVAVPESAAGVWPAATPAPAYDAYSPGTGDITVWKGFQRNHASGLELLQAAGSTP
jgi:alpha-beta hydrolase superfamily lysophospholipase